VAAQLRDAGTSPATIKCRAGVLSAAYNTAIRWGLAESNPVAGAQLPKVGKTKVRAQPADTVRRGLAYARMHDLLLYVFLRIDAITGARRSEILGLTRDDFDADLQTLTIRRRVVPPKGGLQIEETTKSDRGARIISIDAETMKLIQKSLAEHDSRWLFPGKNPQKPLYPTKITHQVETLGKQLGVKLHPHLLRHFMITYSLRNGTPINVVAARAGDRITNHHEDLRPRDRKGGTH
jgi:integrase